MGAVEKLEAAFAEWLGVPGAVATGYGRGALWLALELIIGGRPGAEVLVPDFICQQVPEAVRRAGGSPAYFPVRRDLTVHEADLEAAITGRTRGAVLAHYYGRGLENIGRLAEVCRRRHIVVIEDCALALGARVNGTLVGRFGDLAIFSFTKSDWCYGGGMIATSVRDWLPRLRRLRDEKCCPAPRLALCYGLLRRADFAANTPGFSRAAGRVGAWLERGLSAFEPALRPPARDQGSSVERHAPAYSGNFYDIGRFDALMPAFAARRAQRILSRLDATIARRREVAAAYAKDPRFGCFGEVGPKLMLFDLAGSPSNGAFLLLCCREGQAARRKDEADRAGVALRLSWPAYSRTVCPNTGGEWLAARLLIVELP